MIRYRWAVVAVWVAVLGVECPRCGSYRISGQKIIITKPDKPTPFAFPIMVDRLREKLTSEKLIDRIRKMALQYS